jgi:hypothetical protein
MLEDNNPYIRVKAINRIREDKFESMIGDVAKMLSDPEERVHCAAQKCLVIFKGTDVLRSLVKTFLMENSVVKKRILHVLKEINDHRTVRFLLNCLKSEAVDIKVEIVKTLSKFKHPRIKKSLKDLLSKEKNISVRKEILKALKSIKETQYFDGSMISFVTAGPTGVNKWIFSKKSQFKSVNNHAFKEGLFLAYLEGNIAAASKQKISLFDNNLNLIKEKYCGRIGSIASHKHHLLVSENGCLAVYNSKLKETNWIQLLIGNHQLKNAHEILTFRNTAFLLDNIREPIFVLRIDIRDVTKPKMVERVRILGGANSKIHLDGQWLNPISDTWNVIYYESYSGMMGWGQFQSLISFSMTRQNSEFGYWESEWALMPQRVTYLFNFFSRSMVRIKDESESACDVFRNEFQILANTNFSPPWLLVKICNHTYLANIRFKKVKVRHAYLRKWVEKRVPILYNCIFLSPNPVFLKPSVIRETPSHILVIVCRYLWLVKKGDKPEIVYKQELPEQVYSLIVK